MNKRVAILMFLEAIIIVLIVLFWVNPTISKEYKETIKVLNDSISTLKSENVLLHERFVQYSDSFEIYNVSIDLLNDSLDRLDKELKEQKQKYDEEIENIAVVHSDTLYIKFTKWLESR